MLNTGDRLRALREKYHFSQGDIARRLDVAPSLISAYERGERMPSHAKLVSLADVYHTTTDYILCRQDAGGSTLFLSLDGLSSAQIKLVRELVDTIRD